MATLASRSRPYPPPAPTLGPAGANGAGGDPGRFRGGVDQWADTELPRLYFELPFVGMAISSATSRRLLRTNSEFCRMMGYKREELEGKTWPEITHPDDLDANVQQFSAMLDGKIEGYRPANATSARTAACCMPSLEVRHVPSPDGSAGYTLATINDITERRLAELRLRARDLNAMLSRINSAVAHAEDERSLLADACRIAVESGYFGYARAKCAVAGADGPTLVEYPSSGGTVRIGPTEALDDPVPSQCRAATPEWRDLTDVAAPGPCASSALTRGLRSVASEPLRRGDAIVGSLCLFAHEPGFFEADACHARRGLAQPVVRTRFARPAARARAGRAPSTRPTCG